MCLCTEVLMFGIVSSTSAHQYIGTSVQQAQYEDPFDFNKKPQQNLLKTQENIFFEVWDTYLTKLDGAPCPMYPTCSHFFRLVWEKEGMALATFKTLTRVLKETPDMAKYAEYPLILKYGRYRLYDPIENYNFDK